ncbi:ALF repeat-containing protein [Actinoplanes sp. NPDC023936]|uniref:ALF repeat-containing protein n=1 Tax=Actinoplanes sp. NPDC023936 TaxID=3154910 RepID=UPI00340BF126
MIIDGTTSASRRRLTVAAVTVLALLATLLRVQPAQAAEESPAPADRSRVVQAWLNGGAQVRLGAAQALVGTDEQIRQFLTAGWAAAQQTDTRDAVVAVIADAGPAVRAAAQQALNAADAGNAAALTTFLNSGWQQARNTDARVSVNQLMAAGGAQVKAAAQQALDAEDPQALLAFLDDGWQSRWIVDQRLRVNQAMSTGGPQVRAAGQRALDTGTPEALEYFLDTGWQVAAARDQETETLTGLLAQAQTQGELAAQETQTALDQAAKARAAAEAARRAAELAAQATEAARNDTAQAAAQAKRAADAAQKAAACAKAAVQAAASANRAARAAAAAAQRAASAATQAERAATKAYNAAAAAAADAGKASDARVAAQQARDSAKLARDFATTVDLAGKAVQAGQNALNAAKSAAENAKQAAAANDEAAGYASQAGASAAASVAAARQARADADRAIRAANAAQAYLNVAADAAFKARDAANRAAQHADAAADAAIDAAEHAGEAAEAARRSSEAATAATVAANAAVETATQAVAVYNAARTADAERIAVVRDQGIETARQATTQYEAAQRVARWDAVQAEQRDAETTRLIAEAQNPAADPATAARHARQVAMNLTAAPGVWTRQAAQAALGGTDAQVLAFVRTGIAEANGQDDRAAVRNVAISDNTKLRDAALAALEGSDAEVAQFLRTQNYPGRYTQDRVAVNRIAAAARTAGDVVLAQAAQTALDAEDGQTLRAFLSAGQYTAAATGQRVRVNQILGSSDSGPELKAAAQIALDGPAPALPEFLTQGQYAAAERDHDAAAHLAVVAGLVQRINQVAQTAVENALRAQAAAAQARNDAGQAAQYANQAAQSAQAAAGYATQAAGYADQANESVQKAAAAVRTAKEAATRASASARSAIRSASWAVASYHNAVQSAKEAHDSAQRAYDSAVAAGKDAEAAVAAAKEAYDQFEIARSREIVACHHEYASGAAPDVEKLLAGTEGEWFRNCVANVIADPDELANRAYTNASHCGVYAEGSDLYKNCINSVLAPDFTGTQTLVLLTELVKGITAILIPVAAALAIGCVVTVVCGAVAGTLLTIGDVGLNIYKLINGDQSLAQTLLKLGVTALESLAFLGLAKLVGAGFNLTRHLYAISRATRQAEADIKAINKSVWQLRISACLVGAASLTAAAPFRRAAPVEGAVPIQRAAQAGGNDCVTFPNQLPDRLAAELAAAERLGVRVTGPGTAAFDRIIGSGTVKWAILQDGSLVVVPKFVDGVEISHSVLSRGGPVRAAGEADIAGSASDGYFGLDINNHSGHFRPSAESLDLGKAAFAAAGIVF